MKRATLTPNRFTTFTPNWPAKGLVLFIGLILLGSCIDDASQVGYRKEPHFEVKFKEFKIPTYTVQADSIQNSYYDGTLTNVDKLMSGLVNDPLFGSISATLYSQFIPTVSKIHKEGQSNFEFISLTLDLMLDYYVYGDTTNSESTFKLYQLESDLDISKVYYSNSAQSLGAELATGTYNFIYDSLKSHITRNTDTNANNNLFDSLHFDLTNTVLARQLFDSALSKGVYSYVKRTNKPDSFEYNGIKTDSVFVVAFKGIAVVPMSGNRVLGFKTIPSGALANSTSRLTLGYSYTDLTDGLTKTAKYYYFLDGNGIFALSKYSSVSANRNGTNLSAQPGLPTGQQATVKYNNFTAPDNFCYVQAGTGLYGKLDFTAVRDTFNAIGTVAINAAQIVIGLESSVTRPHIRPPSGFYIRTIQNNNRFFVPPQITAVDSKGNVIKKADGTPYLIADPSYASAFYCTPNDSYLDVRGDGEGLTTINLSSDGLSYSGYITDYLEYYTRLPLGKPRLDFLGLIPSHTTIITHKDYRTFGKFLNGVSFHKDSVKLRVYYTIPK